MQPQVSSPAPEPLPQRTPPPQVVPRRPAAHRPRGRWPSILIAAILIVASVYWLLAKRNAAQQTTSTASPAVRTAAATAGTLDATVRLTGITAAENFSSIMSPQMRGSRGGFGRDRSNATASTTPTATVTSNASNSNANGASGSSSPASSAGGGNLSSALRASTSRVGPNASSTASGTSSASSKTKTSSDTSTAMGTSGIGSTSASLDPGGGGGGGGGMNDFMLVLQKAAKPGAHVKKGDVVAEFDRQYMLLRLDDYKASVVQAEASLRKLRADLDVTRKAHDQSIAKAKAVLDKAQLDMKTLPVLSDMDVVRTKLAVEEAEQKYKEVQDESRLVEISLASQIRNSEIDVQQTKIELRRAEANADRMLIKSPIDGLTVMQTIIRGSDLAQAQEGDQLFPGMMFMTIVDPRSMVISATVNQADVERLRMGARARVHFDAYPDLDLPARVYSVGGIAKPGGQRATFVKEIPIKLKLEKMDARVIPDLSVAVDVVTESETQQATIAPLASIFRDTPSQPYVFVQTPAGWTRRPVELGVVSNTHAAVRSGLKPNEIVALDRPEEGKP